MISRALAGGILDRLAVARIDDAQAELRGPLERREVVAERIGAALRIEPDGRRDPGEQVIAADQDAVAQVAEVPVRVAGQLEHAPPVQLASLVQQLGIVREADERGECVPLLDQLVRDRLGDAVRDEPVGDPLRPVVGAPHALALRVVERALVDGRARFRGSGLGAADVVGMEVRDRDPLDAELAPRRRLEAEAGVEERAVDDVAMNVAWPRRQRQRDPADACVELRDGYLDIGHGDVVGLLHPGEMGAAIGAVLRQRGIEVLWASEGRSEATKARAGAAGTGRRRNSRRARAAKRRRAVRLPAARRGRRRSGSRRLRRRVRRRERDLACGDAAHRAPAIGAFRRRRDRRRPPSEPDGPRLYLSGPSAGVAAAVRRHARDARVALRRRRRRVGAEDGLRLVDEGQRRAPARHPRGRAAARESRRRSARSGASSIPGARGAPRVRAALGRGEGLALGRRDGGDRGDVRGRRPAAGGFHRARPRSSRRSCAERTYVRTLARCGSTTAKSPAEAH